MSLRLPILSLLALVAAMPLQALDSAWELQGGAGTTSNVLRVPVNPQHETIEVLGGNLALAHVRSRLELAALGAVEYQKYQGDSFNDDVIGNFRARAVGTIAPERLRWLGEYYFGQTRISGFGPPTPANRQNISVFSTGPSVNQAIGASDRLRLDARYADFRYEVSRLATRRVELRGAYVHDFSARAHLSLNVTGQRAHFTQQATFGDLEQQETFGRMALSNSRSLLNADLGYTRARDAGAWQGGLLARVTALRRLSSAASLSLSVGRAYSDSGSSFVQLQSQAVPTTTPAASQAVADQFLNEFAAAGWTLRRNRTTVQAALRQFRERYQRLTVNDRTRTEASLMLGRAFTESLGGEVRGSFQRERYEVVQRAYDERSWGAGLTYRPGRAVYVRADVNRTRRVGDATIASFDDTQVWLRIGYSHGSMAAMSAASSLQDAAMMDAAAALDRGLGSWE